MNVRFRYNQYEVLFLTSVKIRQIQPERRRIVCDSFGKAASDTSSISESSDVVPSKILGNPPSPGTTITYTLTVAAATSGSGNRFYINGAENPTIDFEATTLYTGATYRFDQSHSSNAGHPKISETSDGTHNSGTEQARIPM